MVFEYFYNPEKVLKIRLDRNPYYPFSAVEPNVYILSFTTKRHILALLVCAAVVAVTVIVCICINEVTQYVVITVLIFVYIFPQAFGQRGKRVLILDMNELTYEVGILLPVCVSC